MLGQEARDFLVHGPSPKQSTGARRFLKPARAMPTGLRRAAETAGGRAASDPETPAGAAESSAAALRQLRLLGSVTRPPRPRWRVPRRTASGQGATAL